ncbi:hypothetical protein [Embleya scabrispora]|uniref:hypothetical protein n=1 Tax=Embleya scabrispora TaxID=159449 RepID=UPI000376B1D2|nr:hypothetical protein [Embleya scabrispora]MYS80994.1 hypothetical protein [Streptomyces sp. SID5474]
MAMLDEDQARALLRALDDPEHLAAPPDYDAVATRERFDRLVERLHADFGCRCPVEGAAGAASRHGVIVVPAAALAGTGRITLVVSNFGDMVVTSVDAPDDHPVGAAPAYVSPADLERVEAALDELGYRIVPEDVLRTTYDGVSRLADHYTVEDGPTWWIRFFDYP